MSNKLECFVSEDTKAHFQIILSVLNVVMLSVVTNHDTQHNDIQHKGLICNTRHKCCK